jgi:hypothetical protein
LVVVPWGTAPSPLPPDKILGSRHSKLDIWYGVERRPAVQRKVSVTNTRERTTKLQFNPCTGNPSRCIEYAYSVWLSQV